ncbi:hypothetical protein TWF694_008827 [Orbilia ellipsospora]|uniref:Uncharacterized protein n=1 Tax=Orbilia ellipsospora TaxID=2528407 RepID=A0AAV9XD20_9PEZI
MCTDIDVLYACGHRGHPAREGCPDASEIYRGCTTETPTARCVQSCPSFTKTGKVCGPSKRVVISQIFDITCIDKKCDFFAQKFDDEGCRLMLKKTEKDTIDGRKFLNGLSDKEKSEMAKAGSKISQPPVWGRKGPHIKKPRRVKTKEEKERERLEKEKLNTKKELAKGGISTSTVVTATATEKPKKSRGNMAAKLSQSEDCEAKMVKNRKGRKRKIQDVKAKETPTKKARAEPKKLLPRPKPKVARAASGRQKKEKTVIILEEPAEDQTIDPSSIGN